MNALCAAAHRNVRYSGGTMATRTTSFRLSEHTKRQMVELSQHLGMTQTQTLMVAIDRLHQEEIKGKRFRSPSDADTDSDER